MPSQPAPPRKRRKRRKDMMDRIERCETLLKQWADSIETHERRPSVEEAAAETSPPPSLSSRTTYSPHSSPCSPPAWPPTGRETDINSKELFASTSDELRGHFGSRGVLAGRMEPWDGSRSAMLSYLQLRPNASQSTEPIRWPTKEYTEERGKSISM